MENCIFHLGYPVVFCSIENDYVTVIDTTMATCLDPNLAHIQASILHELNYNCMLNYMLIVQSVNPFIICGTCCLLILQFQNCEIIRVCDSAII